jgi:phospholipid/cholesterol/gamma-HCH transport system substrate-binding protein
MKISNETKVGVLTVVALTLLILGYNFLKGNQVFDKSRKIYAVFSEVSTLDVSNDVKIKGNAIGKVHEKKFRDKNASAIVVVISVNTDVNIPKNSTASIASGLVGSSYINIQMGDSPSYLRDGDTIQTTLNPGLLNDITSQVTPTLEKARTAIDSLTMVLGSINRFLDPSTKNNIHAVIMSLVRSSASLEQLLNAESGMLSRSLENMSSVSNNLRKNNDTITDILHNTKVVTGKLAELNLQQVVDSLQSAANELKDATYKINHNNGTLGMLLNDKTLYDNLQKTILGLEILIDDIRIHPKRYVNISVFGKKDKGDYLTSPSDKDSTKKK